MVGGERLNGDGAGVVYGQWRGKVYYRTRRRYQVQVDAVLRYSVMYYPTHVYPCDGLFLTVGL